MKSEDLMLGDYVTFKDSLTEGNSPLKVKIIALGYQDRGKEDEVLVQIGDDDTCDIITIDDEIVGIPLTPEILEKNFTRTEVRVLIGTKTHYIENDDFFDVALNEYTDSIWEFEYSNCESNFPIVRMFVTHVHELQHALKLCGIDKTIEL